MRRALGRGLSQLLSEPARPAAKPPAAEPAKTPTAKPEKKAERPKPVASPPAGLLTIPLKSIATNPRQPRQQFDEDALGELADSIREHGILQPLVVRPREDGTYELIAGERRLRAAKLAKLTEVPVVVRTTSAQLSLELALIENVQREDITAIECAHAYRRLAEEFGLSQDQISQRVGKSRVAVSNTLRLLKLPNEMQEAILSGLITEGHARALLMVDSPQRQQELFDRIIDNGMSVREAERLARAGGEPRPAGSTARKGSSKQTLDPNWRAIEDGLREHFGSPVKLHKEDEGGTLTIEFFSDDDLQRLLDLVGYDS